MTLIVPVTDRQQLSGLAQVTQSFSVIYPPALGNRLQKIYWGPYRKQALANQQYDHNCLGTEKINRFFSAINGTRTSQFDYEQAFRTDYMTKKESLKGKCVLSANEYYYNWVLIEDFTSLPVKQPEIEDTSGNVSSGLPLTTAEIKYSVTANGAEALLGGYFHYVYAVFQRNLLMKPCSINIIF